MIRLLSRYLRAVAFLLSFVLVAGTASALSPAAPKAIGTFLFKGSKFFDRTLPSSKIEELAAIASRPGGTKQVGDELAKLQLPNEVLEDTFARILVFQNRASASEADGWIRRLSNVDGFRAAMRKSMGASDANTVGHLNEIRIADAAVKTNFEVRGIGVPFKDPNKKGMTDIDVLLKKRDQWVAIEAKAYTSGSNIPIDGFRADMLTLAEYRKAHPNEKITTVFSITNKPASSDVWRLLDHSAAQHKVELLVGEPEELIHQIPLLLRP